MFDLMRQIPLGLYKSLLLPAVKETYRCKGNLKSLAHQV